MKIYKIYLLFFLIFSCDPNDEIYSGNPVYNYRLVNNTNHELVIKYEIANATTKGIIITEKVSANSEVLLIKDFPDNETCPVFDFEKENKSISAFISLIILNKNGSLARDFLAPGVWSFNKKRPCVGEYTLTVYDNDL